MRIVGLTGQTGAGKSTVGQLFAERGIPSIDCDRLAREVVEPGTPCLAALAAEFGAGILREDGSLDRRALGRIVFSDAARLARLDELIFPAIRECLQTRLAAMEAAGERCVLLDAPTLFESGVDALCGTVLSVTAGVELRLERICARDGIPPEDARRRMASQHTEEWFRAHSDFVLTNSGEPGALAAQVDALLPVLLGENENKGD